MTKNRKVLKSVVNFVLYCTLYDIGLHCFFDKLDQGITIQNTKIKII